MRLIFALLVALLAACPCEGERCDHQKVEAEFCIETCKTAGGVKVHDYEESRCECHPRPAQTRSDAGLAER
jgi:hypothetical protein